MRRLRKLRVFATESLRRQPDPKGKPGYLRVDTVHQGDRERVKGVYHINAVDAVTQWEVVGCVARLAARRGHELLIRAFRLVLAEYPGARLLLVGKGEGRGRLEALVAELGLAREVLFTGYRDVDLPALEWATVPASHRFSYR